MQHDHSRILRESKLKTAKRREGQQLKELEFVLEGWTKRTGGELWADGIALFRNMDIRETGVF